jgi:serine/threonine-protein kinase
MAVDGSPAHRYVIPVSLAVGDVIDDKYRIVRLLGEGGMGAVYEGENVRIHRKVAIKILHAAIAASKDAVQRFEREAQAAGRIGSEHIVEVLDLGDFPSGDRFMVMEFLDGQPLSSRIKARGRLTAHEVYPIARQILQGLAAAHEAGIVHRDLKPDNVYLLRNRAGQEDFVKLLDFGISKFNALSGDSAFSMTRTGAVMGTPYYMSPEQAQGTKGADQRADLYAIGVILYESVAGRVPFDAQTFNALLFKIVFEAAPPIQQFAPDCDATFASIVQKAMARDPSQRYQSAQEFQIALDDWAAALGLGSQRILRAAASHSSPSPAPATTEIAAPSLLKSTGANGTWSHTAAPPADTSIRVGKHNTALIAATAAGILLFAGVGFAVLRLTANGPAIALSVESASVQVPTEAVRAAAAETQRIDEQKRKAAEEELRIAELKAREAEERAKQTQALLDKNQAEEKAQRQRKDVTRRRAAVASPAHATGTATPLRDTTTGSTATLKSSTPATARAIRTEL